VLVLWKQQRSAALRRAGGAERVGDFAGRGEWYRLSAWLILVKQTRLKVERTYCALAIHCAIT
jgi:hypothetical protein